MAKRKKTAGGKVKKKVAKRAKNKPAKSAKKKAAKKNAGQRGGAQAKKGVAKKSQKKRKQSKNNKASRTVEQHLATIKASASQMEVLQLGCDATSLDGSSVNMAGPTDGQLLGFSGGNWTNVDLSVSTIAGPGLMDNGGELAVNASGGLTTANGPVEVNRGNGLMLSAGSLAVDCGLLAGGGLTNNANIELAVNCGNGLTIVNGVLELDVGGGLDASTGTLQINPATDVADPDGTEDTAQLASKISEILGSLRAAGLMQ